MVDEGADDLLWRKTVALFSATGFSFFIHHVSLERMSGKYHISEFSLLLIDCTPNS